MTMQTSDPIIGKSRATATQLMDYATAHDAERPDFLKDYAMQVESLCQPDDMPDAAIVFAQAAHETGGDDGDIFTSGWWVSHGNPAGLGVTGDSAQNKASPVFSTGKAAARAQVAHLLLYATGQINRGGLGPGDDPRYTAYSVAYGTKTEATTIAELTGKWGMDSGYAAGIVARGNAIFPQLADAAAKPSAPAQTGTAALNMTKGLIPLPDGITERLIPDSDTGAWDNLGQRTIKGITLHRMQGTLWGTDNWFRRGNGISDGLTDYGIDNLTGEMLQWNDPTGAAHLVTYDNYHDAKVGPNRAGWASGPVKDPYGDGAAFVAKYGIDAVNRDRVSIEIGGWFLQPGEPSSHEDPVAEIAWERVAQFCAHFAHDAGIPWDKYPIVPADGFSFLCWHQEFTIGTGKVCPGKTVMDGTDALIARTQDIMKSAQTAGAPSATTTTTPQPAAPYAAKHPVHGKQDHIVNEHGYIAWAQTLTVGSKPVTPREYATPDAKPTGPDLKPGAKSHVAWVCRGDDGQLWVIGTAGSRMRADGFIEFGAVQAAAHRNGV